FQMGVVEMSWGIGALAGGVVIGAKKMKMNKVILINITYLFFGMYLGFSGTLNENAFVYFVLLTIIGGCAYAVHDAIFIVILQHHINEAHVGRVISTYNSLLLLPSITGIISTGLIADFLWISNVFLIAGVIILLTGLVSLFVSSA